MNNNAKSINIYVRKRSDNTIYFENNSFLDEVIIIIIFHHLKL